MAKIVKEVPPSEPTYLVELTQSEVDVIAGLAHDFCDNPQRQVSMRYEVDEDTVKPTPKGHMVLEGIANAFLPYTDKDGNYDYYEFWEEFESWDVAGEW